MAMQTLIETFQRWRAGDLHRTDPDHAPASSSAQRETVDRRSADVPPAVARAAKYRVEGGRETVEAFLVAFILALLFRAFLAEVFVIPTGSMAPTLMGAHKDIFCDQCQTRFEVGASQENSSGRTVVVGGVCPNCRRLNSLDLAGNSDHKTFNGDRIVVNKYAYTLAEPKRWDVIVFKFPGNPKQNYIKRLVGLPNETLTLNHGDVYRTGLDNDSAGDTNNAPPEILRKPADKMLSMSHLVYDTAFQSPALIAANYPARWQPWRPAAKRPPTDSWQIERTDDSMTATLDTASDDPAWLRYFHRWPNDLQWDTAIDGGSLASVDPYAGRAVTDYYAYNSAANVSVSAVYDRAPERPAEQQRRRGNFRRLIDGVKNWTTPTSYNDRYDSGGAILPLRPARYDLRDAKAAHGPREGLHWVGDLMLTADIEFGSAEPSVSGAPICTMEIVEAGIQYQCRFDLSTATATLLVRENGRSVHWQTDPPVAPTNVRTGGSARIRMCNYDQMIRVWVDDEELSFDRDTRFDAALFRDVVDDRPHWRPDHPLDASPLGLAVAGCSAVVKHLRIDRDQYYIASRGQSRSTNSEYDVRSAWRWGGGNPEHAIQDLMGTPEIWDTFDFWSARMTQSYSMGQGQYFPMGDNSPGSLDARSWAGTKPKLALPRDIIQDAWRWHDVHYVPRNLLVGKAVFILWPHPWTSPLPFTPDLGQIEMIR